MNIKKLFEIQKILRDKIAYNNPDRFNKLVLALLVEIGECANETRCFKFWSLKPPSEKKVVLEEYVDCLHFVLEIGIEIGVDKVEFFPYLHEFNIGIYTETNLIEQFNNLFLSVNEFLTNKDLESYEVMFLYFIGISKHLNYTWKEIEQAYMDKNKVNHERQNNGY